MWRGENSPRAFQAPVDVHASADGQVYMFKRRANEYATSSDDEELLEMRPQTSQDQKQDRMRNIQLLERELLDGDSLNKLALQYGCKVADIKRVNNLMKEQDLFALKSIKIPVPKHSLLTETLSDHCDPQEEMPRSSPTPAKPQDRARTRPLEEATAFLMEVDSDLDKLIQNTTDRDDGFSEMSEKPRLFGFRRQRQTSHGADWGIQWWNAVIAMVLIGIVLPLFYVIYFKAIDSGSVASVTDGSSHSNSSTNSSDALQSGHSTSPSQVHEPG
ncbi:unnamed protein product [Ophioblennius macclurei]